MPKKLCDELQISVKQPLGIFPKPTAFLQPSERTFDDPTLWKPPPTRPLCAAQWHRVRLGGR